MAVVVQPNIPKNLRYELTYFRAIQAGPDFKKGDLITLNEQINQLNESSELIVWKNKTSGEILQNEPTIGEDIELIENVHLNLGSEKLKLSRKGSNYKLSEIPFDANYAKGYVYGKMIYTSDGYSIPTLKESGFVVEDQMFVLNGRDEIVNFNATKYDSTTPNIYIEYSQVIK